jgi:hypothetical protein
MKRMWVWAIMAIAVARATPAEPAPEPKNLEAVKDELRAYHDGPYGEAMAQVAAQAQAWLEARAARAQPGEKLAAVFDLDDTLWSCWAFDQAMDMGFESGLMNRYMLLANSPVNPPVREVVRTALRLHIAVFFLTGRDERFRAATEENLRKDDCAVYTALVMQPVNYHGATGAFKTAQRQRLVKAGWAIVLNLGDQKSDLAGGFAERAFKLPNPFYLIP